MHLHPRPIHFLQRPQACRRLPHDEQLHRAHGHAWRKKRLLARRRRQVWQRGALAAGMTRRRKVKMKEKGRKGMVGDGGWA